MQPRHARMLSVSAFVTALATIGCTSSESSGAAAAQSGGDVGAADTVAIDDVSTDVPLAEDLLSPEPDVAPLDTDVDVATDVHVETGDIPALTGGPCGDGVRNEGESCDDAELGGASCESLGYTAGGALACTNLCTFDRGGCKGDWTCTADASEPNEKWGSASPLLPGVYERTLCAGGVEADEDWYVIDTPESSRDAIAIAFDSADGWPSAEVYAQLDGMAGPQFYMNLVPADDGLAGTPARRIWSWDDRNPRPAKVYLRVFGPTKSPSVPYVLVYRDHAECMPDFIPATTCPGGTFCSLEKLSFECKPGCVSAANCGLGQQCVQGVCQAPECKTSSDCPKGEACTWESLCVEAPCSDATACQPFFGGLTCDTSKGYCVDCITAADCAYPNDMSCDDGTCTLSCDEDAFAPNDTPPLATKLTLVDGEFHADLALCGVGAIDMFEVTMATAGPLLVTVDQEPTNSELLLGLVRLSDGATMYGPVQNSGDHGAALFDLEAGSYRLTVQNEPVPWEPDPSVAYSLSLSTHTPECVHSGACSVGKGCQVFACVETSCAYDQDCAIFGQLCDEPAGYCTECGTDVDCRWLEACVGNRCAPTCKDDAFEPNDALAAAKFIEAGVHDLELCKARDGYQEDWFKVELKAGQVLAAFLQPNAPVEDGPQTEWPVLELMQADGTAIPLTGDGTAPLNYQAVGAETVLLRVHPQQSPGSGAWGPLAYRLWVGVDPGCLGTPWLSSCGLGSYCNSFTCVPGCSGSEACSPGQLCLDHQCAEPVCHRHEECPTGEVCYTTECGVGPACDEDWDCAGGGTAETFGLRVCDTIAGRCVECRTDADCYGGVDTCVDGACTFPCTDDDSEPNDTQPKATLVGIGTVAPLRLCVRPPHWTDPLNWPAEQDWYAVDLTEGQILLTEVSSPDLAVAIVLASGQEVGAPPPSTWGSYVKLVKAKTTGRHWIRVTMPPQLTWIAAEYELRLSVVECTEDNQCDAGAFCVNNHCLATTCTGDDSCLQAGTGTHCDVAKGYCVNCIAPSDCGPAGYLCKAGRCVVDCVEDAFEPNGALDEAAQVTLPLSAAGLTLCGLQDEDWFRLPLEPSTHYQIVLKSGPFGPPQMSMELYTVGPSGEAQVVEYMQPVPGGVMIEHTTGPAPAVWLLRVFNGGGSPAPQYELSID